MEKTRFAQSEQEVGEKPILVATLFPFRFRH